LGDFSEGQVSVHLRVREELLQNQGVVHGGAIASLIDTRQRCRVVANRSERESHHHRSDDSLPAAITSGRMTATAQVVRGGRRLFVLSSLSEAIDMLQPRPSLPTLKSNKTQKNPQIPKFHRQPRHQMQK
jgi:uncharacterized protein (TIGR00369 family)